MKKVFALVLIAAILAIFVFGVAYADPGNAGDNNDNFLNACEHSQGPDNAGHSGFENSQYPSILHRCPR